MSLINGLLSYYYPASRFDVGGHLQALGAPLLEFDFSGDTAFDLAATKSIGAERDTF